MLSLKYYQFSLDVIAKVCHHYFREHKTIETLIFLLNPLNHHKQISFSHTLHPINSHPMIILVTLKSQNLQIIKLPTQMNLHNIKPTIKCKRARIMRHPTNIAGNIPRNLPTLRTKTNIDFHPTNKLILLPRLNILTNKTPQRNIMHTKSSKPHPR
jgi:hypothetical protein